MPADLKEAYQSAYGRMEGGFLPSQAGGGGGMGGASTEGVGPSNGTANPFFPRHPAPNSPDYLTSQPYQLDVQRARLQQGLNDYQTAPNPGITAVPTPAPAPLYAPNPAAGASPAHFCSADRSGCHAYIEHLWGCEECRRKVAQLLSAAMTAPSGVVGAGNVLYAGVPAQRGGCGDCQGHPGLLARLNQFFGQIEGGQLLYNLIVLLLLIVIIDYLLRWRR